MSIKLTLLSILLTLISCNSTQTQQAIENSIGFCPSTPQLKGTLVAQTGSDTCAAGSIIGCASGYVYSQKTGLCYGEGNALFNTSSSCQSIPEDVCEQVGCRYDPTAGCLTAFGAVCGNLATQAACQATSGCVWNAKSSGSSIGFCKSNLTGPCRAYTTSASCSSFTCSWDPTRQLCDSLTSTCDIVNDETVCNSSLTCHWNSSTNSCETGFSSCSSYAKSSCLASTWCTWDESNNVCISLTTSSCSAALDSSTCGKLTGCVWDSAVNTCLSKSISSCSSSKNQTSCSALGSCYWDSISNECISTITTGCTSASNQSVCSALKTCTWDGSKCLPSWSCGSFTAKDICTQNTLCGYSTTQGCINNVWCWWYGDC